MKKLILLFAILAMSVAQGQWEVHHFETTPFDTEHVGVVAGKAEVVRGRGEDKVSSKDVTFYILKKTVKDTGRLSTYVFGIADLFNNHNFDYNMGYNITMNIDGEDVTYEKGNGLEKMATQGPGVAPVTLALPFLEWYNEELIPSMKSGNMMYIKVEDLVQEEDVEGSPKLENEVILKVSLNGFTKFFNQLK